MYLEHFGLREAPFSLTPDTGFFLNRAGYQDALNVLLVALRSGEGFLKVGGEVGTGKTLLCRKLVNTLDQGFVTAYVHNPYLDPDALLLAVADELGVDLADGLDRHRRLKQLTAALLRFHARGLRVVVCLDEVQAMPVETLETLRLLTNLETEKRKLLQVVLFGQPELERRLAEPSLRQLRQRISFSVQLLPMNRIGLEHYVSHRMRVAGYRGQAVFSRDALDTLEKASRGIPRLVNILCHKALMLAFGANRWSVSAADVARAASDTLDAQGAPAAKARWPGAPALRWLYSGLGLLAMFAFGALWGTVA